VTAAALCERFPGWRIWRADGQWIAARRGEARPVFATATPSRLALCIRMAEAWGVGLGGPLAWPPWHGPVVGGPLAVPRLPVRRAAKPARRA
jgi:hypothetical protein